MRLPETIAVMRAGGRINAGILHFMDFKDDPHYCWMGFGDLVTKDGITWKGIGDVVSMEGGGQQAGIIANNLTLTLAGSSDLITDEMIARALDSENQVYGRRYFTAIQFFTEDWQPTDSYRVIYVGVMDRMSFKRSATQREISLNIESPFVRRRVPRLELFTDRDQRSKYPDDLMFEFISGLRDKAVQWPKF
jgi:hypothetical protein